MNKLILVVTAVAMLAGACAQTDSTNKKTSPDANYGINQNQDKNNNQNRDINNNQTQIEQNNSVDKSNIDGVMMQNGKMMVVKNGQVTILDREMTMSNGTKIMRDGSYTKLDGTKMTLKEGEHIDMSGKMISMITNKDKDLYLVRDSIRK